MEFLAALPDAAKRYSEMIEKGLGGNAKETVKARVVLRDIVGGSIELEPTKEGLVAHIGVNRGVLVKAVKPTVGTHGSGGRILRWKSLRTKDIRIR